MALYKQVVATDAGYYMAYVKMADIYEAERAYPEAIAMRKHAVDANPDDPSLLMDLGVTQGKAGAFQAAVESLEEAIQGNPRDVRAYFWLAIAMQQLGKNSEARAAYQHFVDVAPSRYERQIAYGAPAHDGLAAMSRGRLRERPRFWPAWRWDREP